MPEETLQEKVEGLFQTALTETAGRPALEEIHNLLSERFKRLQEPLRVAVVGNIGAGKSTFLNALMGEMLVPTGPVEGTFNVKRFKYGTKACAEVHFKDERPAEKLLFKDLEILTLRAEANEKYLQAIEYVDILSANEILQRFSFVDTPGQVVYSKVDSKLTLKFLQQHGEEIVQVTVKEAIDADGVVFLLPNSRSLEEDNLPEELAGLEVVQTNPINTIGVLSKVDNNWSIAYPQAMQQAEKLASRLSDKMGNVFYKVCPLAGKMALGVKSLTIEEFEILRKLAFISDRRFKQMITSGARFSGEYEDVPIPSEQRWKLVEKLGQYGVWLAVKQIREGVRRMEAVQERLLMESGISQIKNLLLTHFGNRAYLLKLSEAFTSIFLRCYIFEQQLKRGEDLQAVQNIADMFAEFENNEQTLREMQVLRSYYRGNLELNQEELQHVLELTGEYGSQLQHRLGLHKSANMMEMIEAAEARKDYWQQKVTMLKDEDAEITVAAKIMAASYKKILLECKNTMELVLRRERSRRQMGRRR